MYSWLLNHKVFGKFIRNFRETRSISLRSKVISIGTMWAMIMLSVLVFIENQAVEITLAALGVAGTVVLLMIRTSK